MAVPRPTLFDIDEYDVPALKDPAWEAPAQSLLTYIGKGSSRSRTWKEMGVWAKRSGVGRNVLMNCVAWLSAKRMIQVVLVEGEDTQWETVDPV